ncbi:acyl-CoA dehydrogenase family protein [Algiphilus aromaticivorans]|uniref:acyl-CoA dehydrogenase family protein n=1 Tax=Algiphilus aromaticivorans TaxID=382454 RepID=UPI0005C145A9|nr:acyl-CoA dehydrogenase family protein [Algiphilus aromaticivorans]
MAHYKVPQKDILFALHDVLEVDKLAELPGFEEATSEIIDGVVDEAAKFVEGVIEPLRESADAVGARWQDGDVILPDGMKEAYKQFVDAGWASLSTHTDFGGQGLPFVLSKVVEEMLCGANVSFALYPGLTSSCFEAIEAVGSDEIKQLYLPKLATGEWCGTMCLTEPQAGSDLAAIKTKATPNDDGSYSLEGMKIFITGGEHQMADNIVHLVLARTPDAPAGIKGLSTFVVPKYMVNDDGSLGERNQLRCVSIEHKMGIHASCTCTMGFDGAKGWMVGEPNHGIQNMFIMMNLARIMVGFQGLGQCELATQNAIAYAGERKQGKSFAGTEAIIDHPDVRRMLLTMRAYTEAGRVMALDTSMHVDIANRHPDAAEREAAQDHVELMTPLVKAFLTDAGFELGSLAVQTYGGHGFIREHGIEQIIRDSKILALYEGTNGIQAMDLVRRKLQLHGGRLPGRYFARVRADLDAGGPEWLVDPLREALEQLETTTKTFQEGFRDDPTDAAYGCCDYLRAFSLVTLGHAWLRSLRAADKHRDSAFAEAKYVTAQHFATRLLPHAVTLCRTASAPATPIMGKSAALLNAAA